MWRPKNFTNPYEGKYPEFEVLEAPIFEDGADTMLEGLRAGGEHISREDIDNAVDVIRVRPLSPGTWVFIPEE